MPPSGSESESASTRARPSSPSERAPDLGEGFVAGDVVNTASRIQGAAPIDGVAVSEETQRQTERVFVYEPLPPVELKGKAEPVELFRAVEARARFGTDLIRTHDSPFVGRVAERAMSTSLFDRCARDSRTQLVTLVGEPGAGKSRLCAELFAHIDELPDLITWRQGRCLPYGDGITFWALGEIVKAQAGIFETDSPDVAAEKLEAALPEVEAARVPPRQAPSAARHRLWRGDHPRRELQRVADLPRVHGVRCAGSARLRGSALGG